MLAFHPQRTVLENQEAMVEAYAEVKTGQVTYAVRDSSYDGGDIHEGEIMGLMDGKIVCTGSAISPDRHGPGGQDDHLGRRDRHRVLR